LKSFIPASEGDVVPIQWDIGSFLNPAGTSRVIEGRVPARSARANRTSVQFLGYSLLLSEMTGKNLCKIRVFPTAVRVGPMRPESPYFIGFIVDTRAARRSSQILQRTSLLFEPIAAAPSLPCEEACGQLCCVVNFEE
jgi:hypothetical protein